MIRQHLYICSRYSMKIAILIFTITVNYIMTYGDSIFY